MGMKRSTNIEILRILAMIMIIMYHIIFHCVNYQLTDINSIQALNNGFFSFPIFYNRVAMLCISMLFGPVANALFILISGYFMANKDSHLINMSNSATKLLTQLGFASIILFFGSLLLYLLDISFSPGLVNLYCFNGNSWYIGYYFLVLLSGKVFLNSFLAKCDNKKYLEFILILFGLSQFQWSNTLINGFSNGLEILLIGLFFYSLGGYIRRYKPFDSLKSNGFILVIIFCIFVVYINSFITTSSNIQSYLNSGSNDPFIQNVLGISNSNILVVLSAISIFELFRRLNIPNNKIINYFGSGTFMVYLIHDNNFFYTLWGKLDWITLLNKSGYIFIAYWFLWTLATFCIGIVCYWLYNLTRVLFQKSKFLFIKNAD